MGAIEAPELLRRHRLTVAQYHRMGETGVLPPDARVELIEGEVVDMAPIGTRHGGTVKWLNRTLSEAVGQRAIVAVQDPLRLGDRSEPQPDLMLLKPRADSYRAAHPTAADVLLLIEVSDTTARYDREIKLVLYARHGVAEVWIVDLDHGQLSVHRHPADGGYGESSATAQPGVLTALALPGVAIDLTRLFG